MPDAEGYSEREYLEGLVPDEDWRSELPPVGSEVLVDCTAYGVRGLHWCLVTRHALGSAAVYPVKVEVPGRGEGQFKVSECTDSRMPSDVEDAFDARRFYG